MTTYKVAHIKNGLVENVSIWGVEPPSGIDSNGLELVEIGDAPVGITWEYSNGTFSQSDADYVWSKAAGKIDLVTPQAEEEVPE